MPSSLPRIFLPVDRAAFSGFLWYSTSALLAVGALVQWATGTTDNLLHDAVFLLLTLVCWRLDTQRPDWGQAALLVALAPFLVWLTVSPGIGPHTLMNCVGYSAVLLLPTVISAVHFRTLGVLAFSLYGLVTGLIGFRPGATQILGVTWYTVTALITGLTLAWLLNHLDRAFEHLEGAALRDPLTGLGNRRAFEWTLETRWQGGPTSIGLLLIDLDGLKQVNDRQGHAHGDALLRCFALALSQRVEEPVFRMGGDEFVVLCPAQRLDGMTGRVRDAVAATRQLGFPAIDASSGVAWGHEVQAAALVGLADQRMYLEKHAKPLSRHRASETVHV